MSDAVAQRLTVRVDASQTVSALLLEAPRAHACLVLAHGAGAGMEHASLSAMAMDLARLGVTTLRFQFPYMERGSKRPDAPPLCHATVRAAVATAARLAPKLPLIAGGRSFGGRMTSQAQALQPLPGVKGLAFLAFPLHPAGKPADERAGHLSGVAVPMLFLQGTRDALAEPGQLAPVIARLGPAATLVTIENADHAFHVPARSGISDAAVRKHLAAEIAAFAARTDA